MIRAGHITRVLLLLVCIGIMEMALSQSSSSKKKHRKILYGLASYYGKGFHGKKTASGEIFNENKLTAACNVLPLGTWVQITNLKNKKVVVVKITDRLHVRMRRIADLSKAAAKKLGYIHQGLTRVKIEVLDQSLYNKK
jgi:rare lipoprotein A